MAISFRPAPRASAQASSALHATVPHDPGLNGHLPTKHILPLLLLLLHLLLAPPQLRVVLSPSVSYCNVHLPATQLSVPLSPPCLRRLGLSLEAALEEASEAPLTPALLEAWMATERQRQAVQWAPHRVEAAAGGSELAGGEAEEEDEEAAARRAVAWRDVRRLLWRFGGCCSSAACKGAGTNRAGVAWRAVVAVVVTCAAAGHAAAGYQCVGVLCPGYAFDACCRVLPSFTPCVESVPARQQLLGGCLLLLGAPLPGALPSNSPAAVAASVDRDELWQAAALAGCHPAGSGSGGCLSSAAGAWATELLTPGDWGWLVGGGGAPAEPRTLRQQPWYRSDPSCHAMLEQLLTALVRGPCRQDASVAAALVAVAAGGSTEGSAGSGGSLTSPKPLDHARTLAKQLLAEQRSNLLLWQVGWESACLQARRVPPPAKRLASVPLPALASPLAGARRTTALWLAANLLNLMSPTLRLAGVRAAGAGRRKQQSGAQGLPDLLCHGWAPGRAGCCLDRCAPGAGRRAA